MFVDTLVIGAGVVGLAIAQRLSLHSQVLVLEQAEQFGSGISSRNSEVIHAGIYYPQDSLKTRLCRRGNQALYHYCQQHGIEHRPIGKLIVASNQAEHARLKSIQQQALQNGLTLEWLNASQACEKQAGLNISAALWSPDTGIIDSHGLMLQLLADIEANSGELVCRTQVQSIRIQAQRPFFQLELISNDQACQISCNHLINAAGLQAQTIAKQTQGLKTDTIPPLYLCHGQYFSYQGTHPFQHLIYPIPQQAGLGIHATLDLAGQLKFGPDSHYQQEEDYWLSPSIPAHYIEAIAAYWPEVDAAKLQPAYAGIRPKLQSPQQSFADFLIRREPDLGAAKLINCFGIESPGLTSCLSLAEHVAQLLQD